MVAFTANNQIYVGNPAKNQAFKNAENTIFDGKRFIGRRFSDREVQSDRKHWPFKVIDQSGRPCVQVTLGKKTIILTPEEISSMVLRKMKEIANDYTNQSNESMTRAVVTVPAYFKDSQRKATLDACTLAGIEVIRMINEPTAAAIAYGFNNKAVEGKNIIVLDIGGGTFDVSILSIDHHTFVVRATSGDSHLGGRDFDNRMMAHFIKHIKRTYHKDISTNPKKLARLRTACEQAKIFLSSNTTATIDIESFLDGEDYSDTITQARFEKLNYDLFNKLFDPIDDAIQKSGLSKSEIDGVILVGGSSRIKLIQSKIESYFKGIPVYKNINPDVAVAHGAAILASSLSSKSTSNSSHTSNTSNTSNNSNNTSNPSNNTSNNTSTNTSSTIQDLRVVDVIPLSLGLETVGGVMTSFIRGNTSIPAKKTKLFTTNVDNQSSVNVKIYEGERPFTRDNYLLDNFILNDIPPAPSGKPRIEVTFDIDINGILNVTAVELSTGQAKSITVVNNQERLSQDEIKRMIEEAKEFKKRDEEEMERLNYKNNLDLYLNQVLKTLRDNENSNNINTTQRETIVSTVNATREWMDDHPETTKEELINKRNELEQMITPILINL